MESGRSCARLMPWQGCWQLAFCSSACGNGVRRARRSDVTLAQLERYAGQVKRKGGRLPCDRRERRGQHAPTSVRVTVTATTGGTFLNSTLARECRRSGEHADLQHRPAQRRLVRPSSTFTEKHERTCRLRERRSTQHAIGLVSQNPSRSRRRRHPHTVGTRADRRQSNNADVRRTVREQWRGHGADRHQRTPRRTPCTPERGSCSGRSPSASAASSASESDEAARTARPDCFGAQEYDFDQTPLRPRLTRRATRWRSRSPTRPSRPRGQERGEHRRLPRRRFRGAAVRRRRRSRSTPAS